MSTFKEQFGEIKDIDKFEKNYKRYEKCLERAMEKLIENYCKEIILENPEKYANKFLPINIAGRFSEFYVKYGKAISKYWMITINPKEIENIEKLRLFDKCVRKMCKKKWIKWYDYNFECKGKNGNWYENIHVHIKIECKKGKRPSEVRRECKNSYKKLKTEFMYDQKCSYRENAFDDYVKGYKKGLKKPEFDINLELNNLLK